MERRIVDGIWDELKTKGYAAIGGLLGRSEGLTLEFKRKSSPERPGLSDDDRKGIAETLSGMSNAVGGVLFFGITCRKEDNLDVADTAQDIVDVLAVAERIRALSREILTPVNHDVEVLPLERPATSTGVVAIRIGPSDNRPHMSVAKHHRRYYLRTVDANMQMLDYQVRDMLRIQTVPRLLLKSCFEKYTGQSGTEYLSITLLMENAGRVSARHVHLAVRASPQIHRIYAADTYFQAIQNPDQSVRCFRMSPDDIIHPGMTARAVRILAKIKKDDITGRTEFTLGSEDYSESYSTELCANFKIFCEDCPLIEFDLTLDGNELGRAVDLFLSGPRYALNELGARLLRRIE